MGGQGKRVRIVVTPRRETERATAWRLYAQRRSTGPVRRAWYDLTLRALCGAPYERSSCAAGLVDPCRYSPAAAFACGRSRHSMPVSKAAGGTLSLDASFNTVRRFGSRPPFS